MLAGVEGGVWDRIEETMTLVRYRALHRAAARPDSGSREPACNFGALLDHLGLAPSPETGPLKF